MFTLKNCLSSTVMLIYSKDLTKSVTKLLIQVPKVTFFLSSSAELILYRGEHSSHWDGGREGERVGGAAWQHPENFRRGAGKKISIPAKLLCR